MLYYSRERGGEHPRGHLATCAGILQADAYSGYGQLYLGARSPGPITEAVLRIDRLFDIDRALNGLTADQRLAAHRELSKPLVTEIHAWIVQERAKFSRGAEVAKAMDYILKRWTAFARFPDDGRICLTKNAHQNGANAKEGVRSMAPSQGGWQPRSMA